MAEIASPTNLTELIARQRWEELRARLKEMHFSDIAEMLATLPPAERAIVFRLLDRDHAAEVFGYLPPDDQAELIHSLSATEVKSRAGRNAARRPHAIFRRIARGSHP